MKLETFKFDIDADGIAHAIFDVPGRSMNTLTGKAVQEIKIEQILTLLSIKFVKRN